MPYHWLNKSLKPPTRRRCGMHPRTNVQIFTWSELLNGRIPKIYWCTTIFPIRRTGAIPHIRTVDCDSWYNFLITHLLAGMFPTFNGWFILPSVDSIPSWNPNDWAQWSSGYCQWPYYYHPNPNWSLYLYVLLIYYTIWLHLIMNPNWLNHIIPPATKNTSTSPHKTLVWSAANSPQANSLQRKPSHSVIWFLNPIIIPVIIVMLIVLISSPNHPNNTKP